MTDEISSYPLAGWTTDILPDAAVLLTLSLVPTPRSLVTGERQLVGVKMTAAQARELSKVLLQLAASTEMPQAPGGFSHS